MSRVNHTFVSMESEGSFVERFCQETYREGIYHKFGWFGRMMDPTKAFQYFHTICQNYAFPPALIELAICHLEGRGVERNSFEGVNYLKRAESCGSSVAANLLADCYMNGTGVDLDIFLAANYYTKAWRMVQQGDTYYFLRFYIC